MNVSYILAKWYENNKRELPWRNTSDSYKIWISEIILQQTRVNQGTNYYRPFLEKFPTVCHLAKSSVDQVLKVWQGLGYYSRARNMHKAANVILSKYNGVFPDSLEDIRDLPGIGEYTSAAIASIAYNKPVPVVDGNVFRVLSRFYGLQESIDSAKGKKTFLAKAKALLDNNNPGRHNQAIMEFGALICTPRNAQCTFCPLATNCIAYKADAVYNFPQKQSKKSIKKRFFYYLLITSKNRFLLTQRNESDIWSLLYQFPLIETNKLTPLDNLQASKEWKKLFDNKNFQIKYISKINKHQLTHQHIFATFIEIEMNDLITFPGIVEIDKNQLYDFAFPRLISKYLEDRGI